MNRYYLHNGTDKEGPYDIDELRTKAIKPNTPVWCEGMDDWTEAGKVNELKSLFISPPPFNTKKESPIAQSNAVDQTAIDAMKDRNIGRYMRIAGLIIVLVVAGMYLSSYVSSVNKHSSYLDKVMTVEEIEKASPQDFLQASGTWNTNFWGDKLKVHGKVVSTATVATYKDVVIQVRYLSETETVLGTERYVLYKFVPPHQTVEFEWTLNRPKDCKNMRWDVLSAVAP